MKTIWPWKVQKSQLLSKARNLECIHSILWSMQKDRNCIKKWKYLPTEEFFLLQTKIVLSDIVSKRNISYNGKCLFFLKLKMSCNGKCLFPENAKYLNWYCLVIEKVSQRKMSFFFYNGKHLGWKCLIKENVSQRKKSFFLGTEIVCPDIV